MHKCSFDSTVATLIKFHLPQASSAKKNFKTVKTKKCTQLELSVALFTGELVQYTFMQMHTLNDESRFMLVAMQD